MVSLWMNERRIEREVMDIYEPGTRRGQFTYRINHSQNTMVVVTETVRQGFARLDLEMMVRGGGGERGSTGAPEPLSDWLLSHRNANKFAK